jgi:hypothetical protein
MSAEHHLTAVCFGHVAMHLLAVTHEAAWVAGHEHAVRLRALLGALAGVHPDVHPDVCLHIGLLEGLVTAVGERVCMHSNENSKPVRR